MLVPTLRITATLEYVEAPPASKPGAKLSPLKEVEIVPVGSAYDQHARRVLLGRTFEDDDRLEAERKAKADAAALASNADADAVESEPETKDLLSLDPKEWKKQDHYAVLGLSKLRYKATPAQIAYAQRKKVVRHHPDKKLQADKGLHAANDDAFFKCIQKAHDTLIDPVKRRAFDSVDEAVSDDYPKGEEAAAGGDAAAFVELWRPVFERESRFSNKSPVPTIGTAEADKASVETFYDFWFTFDSWRSFEYNDKEGAEGGDSRDEKRYAEKKNKAEREKQKKLDSARVRALVETAMANDPRIRRFKAEDRAKRDAKKRTAKPSPAQLKADAEAKKKAEEEAKKAEEAQKAAAGKADRDAAKKAKEAAKKNVKRDRKAIAAAVTSANYFAPAGQSPSPSHVETCLAELDQLLAALEPEDTAALRQAVDGAGGDAAKVKSAIDAAGAKTPLAGKLSQFA